MAQQFAHEILVEWLQFKTEQKLSHWMTMETDRSQNRGREKKNQDEILEAIQRTIK